MEQAGLRVVASKSEPWMEVREATISMNYSIGVVLLSIEPYTDLESDPAPLHECLSYLFGRFLASRVAFPRANAFGKRSDITIGVGKIVTWFIFTVVVELAFFI